MLLSTCPAYWDDILQVVLPQVDVLLNAIVLWVAFRLRGTYEAEQRTLSGLVASVQRSSEPLGPSESRRTARGRKKSSTKGTTST
jgi:hypothetical protein